MYRHFFDSHVHTDNSVSGKHRITFLCETAVNKKMTGFAVTDHYECDWPNNQMKISMANSVLDIRRAQTAFSQLVLACGIELGQPLYNMEECEKVLKRTNYDIVLAALHRDPNHDYYSELDFSAMPRNEIEECLTSYYDEMYKMVKWDGFDVLAHLTYPLKYIEGVHKIPVNMEKHEDVIREILRRLVENGKALELNMSGMRDEFASTMPPLKYLKWFRELGGELVTVGSDTYSAEDLGEGIADGMKMLEEAGFRYFTMYRSHKPVMVRIL